MGIKIAVTLSLLTLASSNLKAGEAIDYSKTIKASEVAREFFGPVVPGKPKVTALNIGRIGISAKTKLNCGRINVVGSVDAEIKNVEKELKALGHQIEGFYRNPGSMAMAVICYMKPNVCSYIRHSSLLFSDQVNLQFDACQAIDSYIDSQADRGMKQLQGEAVQKCIEDRSGGAGPTTEIIRSCQSQPARARDLSQPFKTRYVRGKQQVLKSIVDVVGHDEDYSILAQVLGEVEIHENGYWVPLFSKGLLRPGDIAQNITTQSKDDVCDVKGMKAIIADSQGLTKGGSFNDYVKEVIREKFTVDVPRDLESLPTDDRAAACSALGEGIAELAVKRVVAKGKSVMAAALSNDALPDDLRVFYRKKTKVNLEAILTKIEAKETAPLSKTLEKLRTLALDYRMKNRESASDVSSRRILNDSQSEKSQCDDEFSCSN